MNRQILIVAAPVLMAATASGAIFLAVQANSPTSPQMRDEPREVRETFFGASKELPRKDKGQEMHPR